MRPVHALEHDLPLAGPVEHDGDAVLEVSRLGEHAPRRLAATSTMPHLRLAGLPLHHGAVVDDERERDRQAIDDRRGEMKAAPGGQRDLDAARRGLDERVTVRVRQPAALSSSVPSMSIARRRIMQGRSWIGALTGRRREPRADHGRGSDVYATTAIFHAPPSRTSVNWSTPCETALPSRMIWKSARTIREVIAVDRHHHVRDRLPERRRRRILLHRGDPLVAGLEAVRPLDRSSGA